MYAANQYLNMAANERCAVQAIMQQLNISSAVAQAEYQAATNALSGEVSPGGNFSVDRIGLLDVIDIRARFGGFAR